jgi:hypothetical protein
MPAHPSMALIDEPLNPAVGWMAVFYAPLNLVIELMGVVYRR